MVIDGVWSTVGSTNLDNRSFALNDELNLVVYDREVGRRLEAIFAEDLAARAPARVPALAGPRPRRSPARADGPAAQRHPLATLPCPRPRGLVAAREEEPRRVHGEARLRGRARAAARPRAGGALPTGCRRPSGPQAPRDAAALRPSAGDGRRAGVGRCRRGRATTRRKRLAVQTEDHPLEYGGFEGRDPRRRVRRRRFASLGSRHLRDRPAGRRRLASAPEGPPPVRARGEKLRGRWHLVKTAGSRARRSAAKQQWLFFKAKDDAADPGYDVVAERPESVSSGTWPPAGPERKTAPGDASGAGAAAEEGCSRRCWPRWPTNRRPTGRTGCTN